MGRDWAIISPETPLFLRAAADRRAANPEILGKCRKGPAAEMKKRAAI
jgi:hypothetical protein